MRVLFLVINNRLHASSRIRAYQYEPYLRQAGIKSHFVPNVSETYYRLRRLSPSPKVRNSFLIRGWGKLERLVRFSWAYLLALCGPYDIIFVQKLMFPVFLLRLLDNRQKKVVFEFDDAIYLRNPFQPSTAANAEPTIFNYMLKISRAVVVTSAELSEAVQPYNSNVVRIPGPVDTERYEPMPRRHKNNGEVIVGWIGSPSTVPYLEILYDVFRELTIKYPGLVISVIGSWPLEVEGINLRVKQWSLESEVEDLSHFDIGISLLPDDEWTRGKGGYKLLQYMAMQIPCVASPVGINAEIIREGVNGFTAQSQSDWYNKLSLLIEDAELRQRMGRQGRRIAEEEYSLKANVPKLIDVFRSITR